MKLFNLEEILPILACPVKKTKLKRKGDYLVNQFNDKYPLLNCESPLLFPEELISYCKPKGIDFQSIITSKNPIFQYFGISYVKWIGGDHNSAPDDDCYLQYLKKFKQLVSTARGTILDIGCDDPENTAESFHEDIHYIGIDPLYFIEQTKFKLFAIAEFLPFQNSVFDNVCFGTSLDHAFDPYKAINESARVLKPGGTLYLSTLIWKNNAELYNDSVHFHHFREEQISEILRESNYSIKSNFKTKWKNDTHREVLFLEAKKLN